jgi:toxin ParE1/3/4
MQLEISARAGRDIDAIFIYGFEHFGGTVARSYYNDLFDLFELILVTPHMGHESTGLKYKSRMVTFQSHIVFYRADKRKVRILRVLHGRQNWRDHL